MESPEMGMIWISAEVSIQLILCILVEGFGVSMGFQC
jgi:hypothetical protein